MGITHRSAWVADMCLRYGTVPIPQTGHLSGSFLHLAVRSTKVRGFGRLDIEEDFGNELGFIAGGDVVVDAEFVGIRDDLEALLPAEPEQLAVGELHRFIGAVVVDAGDPSPGQKADVPGLFGFFDGQEGDARFGIAFLQNVFVGDDDAGLKVDGQLVL